MPNRRQHIIDKAAQIVHRKGFASTTVDDILAAAGVGKGNFYHYFRSKDELGVAIIDDIAAWLNGAEVDELFSTAKAPLQRLSDFSMLLYQRQCAENYGDPLANLVAELGGTEPFASHIRSA